MKERIAVLTQGVMCTRIYSSSLEEKADQYFAEDSSRSDLFKEHLDDFKKLLKEGDELIHAMYKSCYQSTDDPYLKLYKSTTLQDVKNYISGNGKNVRGLFKKDPYASGIFNYKVAYTAHETFHEIELSGVVGDSNDE